MNIAERDRKLKILKREMENTQEFVIKKLKKLGRTQHDNEFLKVVYDDYKEYYDHILNEKKKTRGPI